MRFPLLVALAGGLSLSGCFYARVAAPSERGAPEPASPSARGAKISYATWDMKKTYGPRYVGEANASEGVLLALLKEHGIQDAIPSARAEDGRLHITVYELDAKPRFLTRATMHLWTLVSGLSMTVLPLRVRERHPLEVHVVDLRRSGPERFRVHRVEWVREDWVWLGLGLFKSAGDDDSLLIGRNPDGRPISKNWDAANRFIATGIRRALRPVIAETLAAYGSH